MEKLHFEESLGLLRARMKVADRKQTTTNIEAPVLLKPLITKQVPYPLFEEEVLIRGLH